MTSLPGNEVMERVVILKLFFPRPKQCSRQE